MDQEAAAEEHGRVLPFRPRQPTVRSDARRSPVEDLRKYARAGDDDYRHRMAMNLLAVMMLVALVGCSIWLIDVMVQMRKTQDCVLTGQRNCVQIAAPVTPR